MIFMSSFSIFMRKNVGDGSFSSLPQVSIPFITHLINSGTNSHFFRQWQSAQETMSGRSRLFPPCFWTSRNFVNSALVTDALAIHKVVLDASVANAKSLVVLLDSQVLVRMLQAKDSRTGINGIMFHILRLMQWQNQISLFVNSVSNFFYKFIVLYQKIKKSP